MSSLSIDFAASAPVNDLWPSLVEKLGLERSQRAVRQALDLQAMQGSDDTLPVLFCETCGLALASSALALASVAFALAKKFAFAFYRLPCHDCRNGHPFPF